MLRVSFRGFSPCPDCFIPCSPVERQIDIPLHKDMMRKPSYPHFTKERGVEGARMEGTILEDIFSNLPVKTLINYKQSRVSLLWLTSKPCSKAIEPYNKAYRT